ncbi:EAL domain-containing protein [Anaeromyxobacter sp. Fw109-5]|uniref:EAL domain-containing protein n=1 Tax=Anaeromyxobacter sp. (strain Fw109-5) TaxID=404589 RepID=UPI0000ED6CC1|nr:EAL domain-containing protein [Anaeromyxobacter sp. Fw109-5]ABS28434.1 diguanylate phosphodiesterase [Anaeromyxobacter sp. Fw109-5]
MRDLNTAAALRAPPSWQPRPDGLDVVRAGRFGVQYEPIVEVTTGRLHGYEALARFHRRDGVTVPPAVVFERLRAFPELLLRTELSLKRLQVEQAPGPRVFLNVSPDTWGRASASFREVFAASRVEVVVEAVENVHASTIGRGASMLRELARAGITAALDDLGGANVLVSAEELHLARVLKLDRSVLRSVGDPARRALLDGVLSFASRTGKPVVAEGVETAADFQVVRELGIDLAQGDLFREGFRRVMPVHH